ncbi:MAG: DUF805 domain-containing protein [Kiritimatiellia bacterium]
MSIPHTPVPVTRFQQRLKRFCIWIETKFECRIGRGAFALRLALAALVFGALFCWQKNGPAAAPWPLQTLAWLLFVWAAFWSILQIVRRFHDLGRTGGLFWALAVPFWALGKMIDLFPAQWLLWTVLCAWPIWLAVQLVFRSGTAGPNGYDGREFYKDAANP